jgi:S1-C subfamily serine protease
VADAEGWLPIHKQRDHVTVVPSDGAAARAEIVGRHRSLDLALLWVPRRHGHASFHQPIARFDAVPVGQPVFVFGHPERLYFTMSSGLISRRDPTGLLQLSAPVSPGNSGGPAYDAFGRLIGVVTSKVDKLLNPNAENLNFATRADAFLDQNGSWELTGPGSAALERFRNQPH